MIEMREGIIWRMDCGEYQEDNRWVRNMIVVTIREIIKDYNGDELWWTIRKIIKDCDRDFVVARTFWFLNRFQWFKVLFSKKGELWIK